MRKQLKSGNAALNPVRDKNEGVYRGQGGGGRGSQFVHGRSRMTIDPRIPTVPGRSTSGFH